MSKIIRVFSKNADYQKFQVLLSNRNKRHRYGEFLVEGVRNLNQAAAAGWDFVSFLHGEPSSLSGWAQELLRTRPVPVIYQLSPQLMAELSGKESPSELMAVIRMRAVGTDDLQLSSAPLLALFDRPSNKGNLGTIIRSCDALGVEALFLSGHGVDPYEPDVIGATMGSFFRVPVIQLTGNDSADRLFAGLRSRYPGLQTVGTTAHSQTPIYRLDFQGPTLLFLGNETDGLCAHYRECCDHMATIPMASGSSASSFNVACAATALFYEASRQRASAPHAPNPSVS